MRILFLSDNFPPEVNAPASRTYEHCREWVSLGHEVTVITGAPNFPKGILYPGYKNAFYQTEIIDGIRVVRVWTLIAANRGVWKRSLDYSSFMASSFLASLANRGFDVVIGTSPQIFTVCSAFMVGKLKKIPFVFELRDLWPESIKAVDALRMSAIIKVFERLELYLYKKSSKIISVTESFKENLISRGVEPSKIEVVINGVDLTRFRPQLKDQELIDRYGLGGKFVVGYVGTHGMAHALDTLLYSAVMFQNGDSGDDQIRFLFLGDGAEKLKLMELAQSLSLKNVVFVDSVPKNEVARHWSLLDVAIIHLKKDPLFRTVIPSKLFECMGMGIPIAHGVKGESARIVENHNLGLLFEPENPASLYQTLKKMQSNPVQLKAFHRNSINSAPLYDRKKLAVKMLEAIEKTVHSS